MLILQSLRSNVKVGLTRVIRPEEWI